MFAVLPQPSSPGSPGIRRNPSKVLDLLLETPTGRYVRLGDVASVTIGSSPSMIKREGVARFIDVGVDVRGRDLGAVVRDAQATLASVQFPLEHHAELLAGYTERGGDRDRLFASIAAAAILTFLLLQAAFTSWRLAALVFMTFPACLAGGALAAAAIGSPLSIGSIAGFVAVFGLATRNAVLLLTRCRHLQAEDSAELGDQAALRAAIERMGPTIAVAVATALAVLPFLILGDQAGLEVVHPMAVVLLGGLITTALVSLFITPALYGFVQPGRAGDTGAVHAMERPDPSPARSI
jgi:Cu/Ag efflux pump CusA